jgi:hypothetical protein
MFSNEVSQIPGQPNLEDLSPTDSLKLLIDKETLMPEEKEKNLQAIKEWVEKYGSDIQKNRIFPIEPKNDQDKVKKYTLLALAVLRDKKDVVNFLIKNKFQPINSQIANTETPLLVAIRAENYLMVEELVEKHNADVCQKTTISFPSTSKADISSFSTGFTYPLHEAVKTGNMDIINFLFLKDAYITLSQKDSEGNLPVGTEIMTELSSYESNLINNAFINLLIENPDKFNQLVEEKQIPNDLIILAKSITSFPQDLMKAKKYFLSALHKNTEFVLSYLAVSIFEENQSFISPLKQPKFIQFALKEISRLMKEWPDDEKVKELTQYKSYTSLIVNLAGHLVHDQSNNYCGKFFRTEKEHGKALKVLEKGMPYVSTKEKMPHSIQKTYIPPLPPGLHV